MTWATNMPRVACQLRRVSLAEIGLGIERAPDPAFRAERDAWFRDGVPPWLAVRILDVTERVLPRWRWLVWQGQKTNYTFAQPDALLAAIALEHNLGVVTRNTADFQRADIRLLNPWVQAA